MPVLRTHQAEEHVAGLRTPSLRQSTLQRRKIIKPVHNLAEASKHSIQFSSATVVSQRPAFLMRRGVSTYPHPQRFSNSLAPRQVRLEHRRTAGRRGRRVSTRRAFLSKTPPSSNSHRRIDLLDSAAHPLRSTQRRSTS